MRGFSCTQLSQFFQYGRRGYGAVWPYGVVFLVWDDAFRFRKCFKNCFVLCYYLGQTN